MILKALSFTIVFSTFWLQSCENHIVIRSATLDDLDGISAISRPQYQENYKAI